MSEGKPLVNQSLFEYLVECAQCGRRFWGLPEELQPFNLLVPNHSPGGGAACEGSGAASERLSERALQEASSLYAPHTWT